MNGTGASGPSAEELLYALTLSIGEVTTRLNEALYALHTIAREDYRGPKPEAVAVAERALRRLSTCECHTSASDGSDAHG